MVYVSFILLELSKLFPFLLENVAFTLLKIS